MVKGLYIHVPFCLYKCPYCDFLSVVDPQADYKRYLSLVLKELELYGELSFELKTLYFGGGTPSLIEPELYEEFLRALGKLLDLSKLEEVSLECNPENYTEEDFKSLRAIGFNRLSFGVQSLREEGLRALGRLHSVETAIKSLCSASKAGFENINIDLMFGYQSQTLEDLRKELSLLSSLPVSHASFYLLTPYEDTLFGNLYRKGLLELPDQELMADMYELICESLEALGFVQYEVSNFAIKGYECKHNLLYWTHEEFLGLGPSAWSFVNKTRSGNTKNIKLYEEKVLCGERPVEYVERLEGSEELYDYLFVALRTTKGVKKELLGELWKELSDLFEEEGDRVRLNRKGMLLINEVLLRLMVK